MSFKAGIRNPGLMIRKGKAADASAMLELEKLFPSDRMSARSVRNFLASPSAMVWIADSTSPGISGCLILLCRSNSRIARIYSVVVNPAARGRGLGLELVRTAEHWARRQGRRCMSLEVREDNVAARALYARLGYHEHKRLPAYYDDGAAGLRLRKLLG